MPDKENPYLLVESGQRKADLRNRGKFKNSACGITKYSRRKYLSILILFIYF